MIVYYFVDINDYVDNYIDTSEVFEINNFSYLGSEIIDVPFWYRKKV